MPPWLLVDTQPDTLDTRVTRDTPVTCVTRDTRMPMGTGKENDAPGPKRLIWAAAKKAKELQRPC